MPHVPAPAPFTDADYELIAAAVLETARGRWFLAEHARRNRHADTRLILEAIEKLERTIAHRPEMPESDRMRVDLVEMMNAIRRTKTEIAAIQPDGSGTSHIDQASLELDAIVAATEKATSDILAAAERVQEIAWTLREQGVDPGVCDLIDAQATEVYQACSFQDLTGQRTRKVVEVLRFLEARIDAMVRIWQLDRVEADGRILQAPQLRGGPEDDGRIPQQTVDKLIGNERKPDVFWRDSDAQGSGEPNDVGAFDLDDLVVYEARNDMQQMAGNGAARTDSPAPAHSAQQTPVHLVETNSSSPVQAQLTGQSTAQRTSEEGGIDSLTYAERMALFA